MRIINNGCAALALAAVLGATASGAALAGHKAKAKPASCPALNAVDPDNDGSMTRLEALRAAKKTFYRLNKDKDRTLEAPELAGRMSAKAIAAADIRKDGKISLVEYLVEVNNRLRWANTDKDRTIECDELNSKKGRLLYRLLK